MKLKDVDVIPDGYWTYWEVHAAHSYIAALPTVEAIPKEWIRKYTRREISASDYWAIVRMFKEWEKENGIKETGQH